MSFFLFSFQTFIESHRFFEQYEIFSSALKQAAEIYIKSDSSSKTLFCFISGCLLPMYIIQICLFGLKINSLIINFMLQGLRPVTEVSPKTV